MGTRRSKALELRPISISAHSPTEPRVFACVLPFQYAVRAELSIGLGLAFYESKGGSTQPQSTRRPFPDGERPTRKELLNSVGVSSLPTNHVIRGTVGCEASCSFFRFVSISFSTQSRKVPTDKAPSVEPGGFSLLCLTSVRIQRITISDMSDEPISFRVPTNIYRFLKKMAESEYLTISQYLRKLIREAMAKEQK